MTTLCMQIYSLTAYFTVFDEPYSSQHILIQVNMLILKIKIINHKQVPVVEHTDEMFCNN